MKLCSYCKCSKNSHVCGVINKYIFFLVQCDVTCSPLLLQHAPYHVIAMTMAFIFALPQNSWSNVERGPCTGLSETPYRHVISPVHFFWLHMRFLEHYCSQPWFDFSRPSVDLTKAIEVRQRLDSQLQENEIVQKVITKRALVWKFLFSNSLFTVIHIFGRNSNYLKRMPIYTN